MSERIKKIADDICEHCKEQVAHGPWHSAIMSYIASLPEFKASTWIKCSERMPEINDGIYVFDGKIVFASFIYASMRFADQKGGSLEKVNVTHWMPRQVPAPPIEEDSDTIKAMKQRFPDYQSSAIICDMIDIVRRYEKGMKK